MISVIVPVYNVEPYLRKCLDSILNQTYRDLEILVIDDGSKDGSGAICDEYSEQDKRIRVFHTENRGLSAARNLGLDEATREWIGFVDSDDWIELNTFECLLNACENNNAEASCCGHYKEYINRSEPYPLTKVQKCFEGEEVVAASMKGDVFEFFAWNKLWKRELFDGCRFPPGMQFEDIATTWKLFVKCHRVVCVPNILFHYVNRKNSICNTKTMKNLSDRWIAFKERYDVMSPKSEELKKICIKNCLETIGYTWRWLWIVKDRDEEIIQEMREFLIRNTDNVIGQSLPTRISLFCALHSNPITIAGCYYLNQIYRKVLGINQLR